MENCKFQLLQCEEMRKIRIQNTEYRIQNTEYRIQNTCFNNSLGLRVGAVNWNSKLNYFCINRSPN
jgi:hypothetical protein